MKLALLSAVGTAMVGAGLLWVPVTSPPAQAVAPAITVTYDACPPDDCLPGNFNPHARMKPGRVTLDQSYIDLQNLDQACYVWGDVLVSDYTTDGLCHEIGR